jgi:hypothetical protein
MFSTRLIMSKSPIRTSVCQDYAHLVLAVFLNLKGETTIFTSSKLLRLRAPRWSRFIVSPPAGEKSTTKSFNNKINFVIIFIGLNPWV